MRLSGHGGLVPPALSRARIHHHGLKLRHEHERRYNNAALDSDSQIPNSSTPPLQSPDGGHSNAVWHRRWSRLTSSGRSRCRGRASYLAQAPVQMTTNCTNNGNVNCTTSGGSYTMDTLRYGGVFRAGAVSYFLGVRPSLSLACSMAQGFQQQSGHVSACGTRLSVGSYTAKLSGERLTVVSSDGKRKANYDVLEITLVPIRNSRNSHEKS
jgi:hypothetical protein